MRQWASKWLWQAGVGVTLFGSILVLSSSLYGKGQGKLPKLESPEDLDQMTRAIETQTVGARSRIETRSQITIAVLTGRMSLLQAANAFERLNENSLAGGRLFALGNKQYSDGERVCRQVIQWVGIVAARTSQSHAEEVTARLERELNELLRRDPECNLTLLITDGNGDLVDAESIP